MKRRFGFTVVEIIIVITVISILAGIGIVSYSGMQVRARDTERQADVEAIAAAFETYYEQYGTYPSHREVTNANNDGDASSLPQFGKPWLQDTLRLSEPMLISPSGQSSASTNMSIVSSDNASANPTDANTYLYYTLNNRSPSPYSCWEPRSGGAYTPTDYTSCVRFSLKYMKEQGGEIVEIRSKFGW